MHYSFYLEMNKLSFSEPFLKDWNYLKNKNYKYFFHPFGKKIEYIFAMEIILHEKLKESAGSVN